MKILHLIDRMDMGGAQSLVVEIAKVQKEQGNEVEVVQLLDSHDRTFPNRLMEMGIPVTALSRGSMYNPMHIFRIRPILKNYDIVHVHLFPALYWTGFANWLNGCKTSIIYTEHSTQNKRRNKWLLNKTDKFVYTKCYKCIIACADKALETFLDFYPMVNVMSIPNGVDIARYMNATPYTKKELIGTDEDVFTITMVARYTYPKRQDTIIEAIAKLPEKFHAILVGSKETDPESIELRAKCEQLGVADRVHSLYIRKDVPQILKSSEVVCMSSIYEGLSLSSIEGMASGHPFLATNVNGLREVVQGAGELFELGNSQELADLLQKLADDKAFYEEVSIRCIERAKQFDIHEVVNKYMNVYKKYVKENRHCGRYIQREFQ